MYRTFKRRYKKAVSMDGVVLDSHEVRLFSVGYRNPERCIGHTWPSMIYKVYTITAPLTSIDWTFEGQDQGWGNTGSSYISLDLVDPSLNNSEEPSVLCQVKQVVTHGMRNYHIDFTLKDEIVRRSRSNLELHVIVCSAPWPGWSSTIQRNRLTLRSEPGLIKLLETLRSTSTGPWHRSKLMVIGQGRAGKTATVRSLLGESFDSNLESTVGASLKQTTAGSLSWQEVDSSTDYTTEVVLNNVVNSNLSSSSTPTNVSENTNGSKTPANVSESTRKSSPHGIPLGNGVNGVVSDIEESVSSMAVKNEGDSDRIIMFDEALVVQSKDNREASINFTIWDYGGQTVFYTLHHLFLTRYGIYLLCFDLRKMFEKRGEAIEYLEFWINSLRLHASQSPVLLIGTFYDKIKSKKELNQVRDIILKLMEDFPGFVKGKYGFFPLNNKTKDGVESIRMEIEKSAWKEEYVTRPVPLRWMKSLDIITKDRDVSCVSLKEFEEVSLNQGIANSQERQEMLTLFHELGVIYYSASTSALMDVITLSPQWLIENISKVIRDRVLHRFNKKEMQQLTSMALDTDVDMLFSKALVSEDLLRFLWGNTFDFFLDFMKVSMLLSEWKFDMGNSSTASNVQKYYLIPSMLQSKNGESEKISSDYVVAIFDFTNGMPVGVFERVECLLIASKALNMVREPMLSRTSMAAFCQLHDNGESEQSDSTTETANEPNLKLRQEDGQRLILNVHYHIAAKCLNIIRSAVFKIKTDLMGTGFTYDIKVEKVQKTKYMNNGETKDLSEIEFETYEQALQRSDQVIWSNTGNAVTTKLVQAETLIDEL